MNNIPQNYYRISAKALILNEDKKFLLFREENGIWELPGGGIDFGETPQECLRREILEEAGLTVLTVEESPSYFVTAEHTKRGWVANILFKATVEDTHFTASEECVEVRYFSKEEALQERLFKTVEQFAQQFDPNLH